MARGRRGYRGVSQVQRRGSVWLASGTRTVVPTLAAATKVVDSSFPAGTIAPLGPLTITRTRGTFWICSDQVVAQEEPFGAFGMLVVSEQAQSVGGAASIPGPGTDASSDLFFVHQYFLGSAQVSVGAPTSLIGGSWWSRYDFDSKAKRKVEGDGESIVVMVENLHATHGLRYLLNFRMLVLLH